jgi:D-alanyl-D-alanine dipeptidase
MKYILLLFLVCISLLQCKDMPDYFGKGHQDDTVSESPMKKKATPSADESEKLKNPDVSGSSSEEKEQAKNLKKGDWVELSEEDGFMIEIKYATKDNFTHKVIYDCEACFLRPEVARALIEARKEIREKYGYGIKLLDCYRPGPFQQRLWDIKPDEDYVAHPTKGSMHSRGTAVDLTLVDEQGNELDMGTPFDYFGEEAHQDYKGHSDAVNRHRYILRSTMKKYGLEQIRTEWWHYSYRSRSYPLEDWVWECD